MSRNGGTPYLTISSGNNGNACDRWGCDPMPAMLAMPLLKYENPIHDRFVFHC